MTDSTVYVGNPLFKKYYTAYDKPIDKSYYLTLFDERFDYPPYKPEILGEELGYLHNVMVNDIAIALLYQSLMSRETFVKTVNSHTPRFRYLIQTDIFPSNSIAVVDLTQIPKIPFFEFFDIPKYTPKHYIKYTAQQMPPGAHFEFVQNDWTRYTKGIMRAIPNVDENYVKQKPEKKYRFIP